MTNGMMLDNTPNTDTHHHHAVKRRRDDDDDSGRGEQSRATKRATTVDTAAAATTTAAAINTFPRLLMHTKRKRDEFCQNVLQFVVRSLSPPPSPLPSSDLLIPVHYRIMTRALRGE